MSELTENAGRVLGMYKGIYNPKETYKSLDKVYFKNSTYVAKKTITGIEPEETGENWQIEAKGILDAKDVEDLKNATAINIIPYPYVIFRAGNTYRSFGVEFVFSPADGSVSLTGKTDNNGEIVSELLYDGTPKELGLRPDTKYILHMSKDILNKSFIKIGENFYTDTGEGAVFKVDKTEMDSVCHIGITPNPEKTYAGEKIYPMLENGDEAHDFVKYIARGIKINEVLQNVNDGIENALINIVDKEETIEQSISNMTSGGKLKDLISHVKSFMIGAKSILDLCVKTGQIVQQNIDNQNTVPSSALVYSLINEINSNLETTSGTISGSNIFITFGKVCVISIAMYAIAQTGADRKLFSGVPIPRDYTPYGIIQTQSTLRAYPIFVSASGEVYVRPEGISINDWIRGSIVYICK